MTFELHFAAAVAALVFGVYHLTQPGQPLHLIRRLTDKAGLKDGEARTWYYPVLYCPRCMSSLWTAVSLYLSTGDVVETARHWPLTAICCYAILTFITNQMYE